MQYIYIGGLWLGLVMACTGLAWVLFLIAKEAGRDYGKWQRNKEK